MEISNTKNLNRIILDLTKFEERHINLIHAWIKLWLTENCKSNWHTEIKKYPYSPNNSLSHHIMMMVSFSDYKEAIYFKLNRLYETGDHPKLCEVM